MGSWSDSVSMALVFSRIGKNRNDLPRSVQKKTVPSVSKTARSRMPGVFQTHDTMKDGMWKLTDWKLRHVAFFLVLPMWLTVINRCLRYLINDRQQKRFCQKILPKDLLLVYICYLPSARSGYGKTMHKVWKTAQVRMPRGLELRIDEQVFLDMFLGSFPCSCCQNFSSKTWSSVRGLILAPILRCLFSFETTSIRVI